MLNASVWVLAELAVTQAQSRHNRFQMETCNLLCRHKLAARLHHAIDHAPPIDYSMSKGQWPRARNQRHHHSSIRVVTTGVECGLSWITCQTLSLSVCRGLRLFETIPQKIYLATSRRMYAPAPMQAEIYGASLYSYAGNYLAFLSRVAKNIVSRADDLRLLPDGQSNFLLMSERVETHVGYTMNNQCHLNQTPIMIRSAWSDAASV